MNFIHPPEFKQITNYRGIEQGPLPKKVILPLSQHTGAPSQPVVEVGDTLKAGTLVAKSSGFISSDLHSSISGKVVSIEERPHPIIGDFTSIVIESDGQDERAFSGFRGAPLNLSKEEIVSLVKDAGIVGLGGAAFPTHVKLSPPPDKKIDTLLINGAECEPFLTCDHRLMLERPKEIIMGTALIAKVLGVEDVIIGVEENKLDAIESLGSALFRIEKPETSLSRAKSREVQIKRLKTRYPQGGEKQLIETLLGREVPSRGLPLDVGVVVHNVQTVFSVYEAVYFKKPLYERLITVSGSFLKKPGNFLVRIGTPIKDILEFSEFDFKSSAYKIIMGGPMTGVAQCDLEAPIVKGTSGILVLDRTFKEIDKEESCIRCSRCIDSCPIELMPCMIGLAVQNNRFDLAGSYSPLDCIECGSCGYVCPSKIPLVQLIKLAKIEGGTNVRGT